MMGLAAAALPKLVLTAADIGCIFRWRREHALPPCGPFHLVNLDNGWAYYVYEATRGPVCSMRREQFERLAIREEAAPPVAPTISIPETSPGPVIEAPPPKERLVYGVAGVIGKIVERKPEEEPERLEFTPRINVTRADVGRLFVWRDWRAGFVRDPGPFRLLAIERGMAYVSFLGDRGAGSTFARPLPQFEEETLRHYDPAERLPRTLACKTADCDGLTTEMRGLLCGRCRSAKAEERRKREEWWKVVVAVDPARSMDGEIDFNASVAPPAKRRRKPRG